MLNGERVAELPQSHPCYKLFYHNQGGLAQRKDIPALLNETVRAFFFAPGTCDSTLGIQVYRLSSIGQFDARGVIHGEEVILNSHNMLFGITYLKQLLEASRDEIPELDMQLANSALILVENFVTSARNGEFEQDSGVFCNRLFPREFQAYANYLQQWREERSAATRTLITGDRGFERISTGRIGASEWDTMGGRAAPESLVGYQFARFGMPLLISIFSMAITSSISHTLISEQLINGLFGSMPHSLLYSDLLSSIVPGLLNGAIVAGLAHATYNRKYQDISPLHMPNSLLSFATGFVVSSTTNWLAFSSMGKELLGLTNISESIGIVVLGSLLHTVIGYGLKCIQDRIEH